MSVLRQAWEGRSAGMFTGVAAPSPVPENFPGGYGTPGNGSWLPGMRWQPWGGSTIDPDQAMRLSAVFGCLRIISEAIATFPLVTFKKDADGTPTPCLPPPYLRFQPPQGSRITYLSQVMLSLLTDGNAFNATPRDEYGVPLAVIPLQPGIVKVGRRDGRKIFVIDNVEYSELDIMHIAGMTLPGEDRGLSPLAAARDVIDGGNKAQEYGAQFIGNNAMPPGVIEMPDDPADGRARERAKKMAEVWQETHGGVSNAGKVGVLLGGATLKTIAVSPADAEWLDSRRFGVQEIARFYGVPSHLLNDASNSTSWGSGLAEQNSSFGQYSLRSWVERIDDAHDRLLTTHGETDTQAKLDMDASLRPSLKERYESYEIGIRNEFLVINDVNRAENKPLVPWGDEPRPSTYRETVTVNPGAAAPPADPAIGGAA